MILVANYKMNGGKRFYLQLNKIFNKSIKDTNLVLCPPFVYLDLLKSRQISLGAQDVSWADEGKSTGQISAKMLKEFNVKYVLVGHCERRKVGDTDDIVAKKVQTALANGIVPIICVGENKNEDKFLTIKTQTQKALKYVQKDANVIFAYEPVWAIGTGKTPTINEIDEAVETIKKCSKKLSKTPKILYGGSVTGENYKELMNAHIDGFLCGGISLKIEEFLSILKGI